MKKKLLVGVLAVLGVLVVVIVVGAIYFQGTEKLSGPNCSKLDSGWVCSQESELQLITNQQFCKSNGGEWKCVGFCLPYDIHYCDLPNTDGGNVCKDTSECQGKCVVNSEILSMCSNDSESEVYKCPSGVMGECSGEILRNCDQYNELTGGVVVVNDAKCG